MCEACARRLHRPPLLSLIQSLSDTRAGRPYVMGELQYPGAPSVDDERHYRAPFRRAPQYRWPAPQPPQPSAFAPWRRAPAPPRPPDYRRSASYPGKPEDPYQYVSVRDVAEIIGRAVGNVVEIGFTSSVRTTTYVISLPT
ncbi:hypothetical protein KGM_204605 [Danaus plexippus plexippus]|uniref:Uncharacterized protein n=1 Tax=Danaus plexippus plexippus TaxID=278856 RepID=A0A212F2M2_DANPL|nr:hypothetical protein KGM_204605 [Danaus plexippus plexippus]